MIRDQEKRMAEAGKADSAFSINLVVASHDQDHNKDQKKDGRLCQICSKKGQSASNCYNRFNGTNFPS